MNRYLPHLGLIVGIALIIVGLYFNQLAKEKEAAKKNPCEQVSK